MQDNYGIRLTRTVLIVHVSRNSGSHVDETAKDEEQICKKDRYMNLGSEYNNNKNNNNK
jgi:hypothetical protein